MVALYLNYQDTLVNFIKSQISPKVNVAYSTVLY